MAVCIVNDSRLKVNATREWATKHGIFDEELMTVEEQGLDVTLHLFERRCSSKRSGTSAPRAVRTSGPCSACSR